MANKKKNKLKNEIYFDRQFLFFFIYFSKAIDPIFFVANKADWRINVNTRIVYSERYMKFH